MTTPTGDPPEPIWAVFTKPWQTLDGVATGRLVAGLGFTGAEVPVRPTAFVTPATAETALPRFARELVDHGVKITSIAADLSEPVFAAAAASGVPLIRTMAPLASTDYRDSVAAIRTSLEAVVPLVERYGVQVGVQAHHGRYVTSTLGVLDLLDGLPDAYRLVWDAGHDALAGDDPEVTLPLASARLGLVNLKNALYRRTETGWRQWWVPGADGLSEWRTALTTLRQIDYRGAVCLCAEYSDPVDVPGAAAADLALASRLWAATG